MFLLLLLLFLSLPFSSIQHHSTFLFVYIFPNKLWFSAGICGLLQLCWSVISCVLLHATYFFMLVSTPAYCKKKTTKKTPYSFSTQWQRLHLLLSCLWWQLPGNRRSPQWHSVRGYACSPSTAALWELLWTYRNV